MISKASSKRYVDGLSSILKIRGYKVLEVQEDEEGIAIIAKNDDDTGAEERVLAYIPNKEVVGVKIIRDLVEKIEEEKFTKAIVSTRGKFTPYAKKEAVANNIDILSGAFPLFEVFAHNLVPIHEIAAIEETEALQKKYGIALYQLPKISQNDPVVRTLGAHVGDVLRVTRESLTTRNPLVYRIVSED